MKKTLSVLAALFCVGCAPMLPGFLETGSTLLTLGSLGQTAIKVTQLGSGEKKLAVGYLPHQYVADKDRMIRETWEQNYQLVMTMHWEGEDVSWRELGTTVARKAEGGKIALALVQKSFSRNSAVDATVTVYITPKGIVMHDPMEMPGEPFYPEFQEKRLPVAMHTYTTYFFARSRQPSGILATEGSWDGPCRTAYGYGALILAVGKKTPADRARLQSGEVITGVNGHSAAYGTLFGLLQPGENTLNVCRNGQLDTKRLLMPAPADNRPGGTVK